MNYYDLANRYEKLKKSMNRHSSIEITDNRTIKVENCRSVEFFDENRIMLTLFDCCITITGLELEMSNYSYSSIYIKGKLHSIEFNEVTEKK